MTAWVVQHHVPIAPAETCHHCEHDPATVEITWTPHPGSTRFGLSACCHHCLPVALDLAWGHNDTDRDVHLHWLTRNDQETAA